MALWKTIAVLANVEASEAIEGGQAAFVPTDDPRVQEIDKRLVRIETMADMSVGPGFWAFIGLILISTAALASFDPRVVWDVLDREGDAAP